MGRRAAHPPAATADPHGEEPPTGPRAARPDDRLRGVSNHEAPDGPTSFETHASALFRMRGNADCDEAGLPASPAAHQADNQKQDDGADRRIDDLGDEAGAEMNPDFRKQQARNQRAGDADQDVADDAEAGAADDLAGEPARNQADEQDDDDDFVGQDHCNSPSRANWRGGSSLP